jgi:hypothetical protein
VSGASGPGARAQSGSAGRNGSEPLGPTPAGPRPPDSASPSESGSGAHPGRPGGSSRGQGPASIQAPGSSAAPLPRGFANAQQFSEFGHNLHAELERAGYGDTAAAFQGSSVTGESFRTGKEFDLGRQSDYDIALGGEQIFDAANRAGIGLRGGKSRTGPLTPANLQRLGLGSLGRTLRGLAGGRPVNFMIYRSIDEAIGRSPSIQVPRP